MAFETGLLHRSQVPFAGSWTIWKRLAGLAVYAAAMGLLETICVIYLRRLSPFTAGAEAPQSERLRIELIREVATLVMLVAVAWLAGGNTRSRVASFFFAFGIWDIVYYAGFWWLVGWPSSPLQWDCLFLIPKPWYGPVLAPVLISVYFVLACCWVHTCELRGKPLRFSISLLTSQQLACLVWYWSFVKDADHISAHRYAGVTYSWLLCGMGILIGAAGLSLPACLLRPHPTRSREPA